MDNCRNLIIADATLWHNDVFDHPDYEYVCAITKKEVVPSICCNEKRCRKYFPEEDHNG